MPGDGLPVRSRHEQSIVLAALCAGFVQQLPVKCGAAVKQLVVPAIKLRKRLRDRLPVSCVVGGEHPAEIVDGSNVVVADQQGKAERAVGALDAYQRNGGHDRPVFQRFLRSQEQIAPVASQPVAASGERRLPDLAHVGVVQPVGAEKVLPHLGLLLTAVAQARICGEGDLDLVAAPVDKGHVDVNIADGRGEHVQIVQQQRRGKFHGKPDSKVL